MKISSFLYYLFRNTPEKLGGDKFRSYFASKMFKFSGKNIKIRKGAIIGSGKNTSIDDNSRIGTNCRLMIKEGLIIGKNVEMGPDVIFIDVNHNISNTDVPIIFQGDDIPKAIIIGDDVWIGARSIILPGVHVGKGTVIGAGTVLTKSTEEYSVVAGNPGKLIKKRK
jgi:maltose O-acetyltransferase